MFMAVVTVTAEAQVFGSQRMRARIPFAFNVGQKSLPAGEYTIAVVNPSSDRKVLQIRSVDGKLSALIQTGALNTKAPEKAKLVFNRYGDRYFFSQAQMAGESTTLAAVKSKAERNEERIIASKGGKKTITILPG
jgi:hypothetical protein